MRFTYCSSVSVAMSSFNCKNVERHCDRYGSHASTKGLRQSDTILDGQVGQYKYIIR